MSTKQEIETWIAALAYYDRNDMEGSIVAFQPIADTSKILFNCGLICATLGAHQAAIEYYEHAVKLDKYLAIAYFQKGVSNFLQGSFEAALVDFNDVLTYMRGNKWIDYEQLGLKYKLWSCEARFNRALCYLYLQDTGNGMHEMLAACRDKGAPRHDVIDEAIRDKAEGYVVFSIPTGCIFRPNEAKARNIMTRDYLGKAVLVASSAVPSTAPSRGNSIQMSTGSRTSADTSNFRTPFLVRSGLRMRQQSEPPLNRREYPSTPSSEYHTPIATRPSVGLAIDESNGTVRSQSVSRRPSNLELGPAAFDSATERSRIRNGRSESERPVARRRERESFTSEASTQLDGSTRSQIGGRDFQPSTGRSRDLPPLRTDMSQRRPLSVEEESEESHQDLPRSAMSPIDSILNGDEQDRHWLPFRQKISKPELTMKSIRLKIHFGDDTRFLIIPAKYNFEDLAETLARKLATDGLLKVKTRDDEGDMITIADQEDLDVSVSTCRELAHKEGRDMGKLEIWVYRLESSRPAVPAAEPGKLEIL